MAKATNLLRDSSIEVEKHSTLVRLLKYGQTFAAGALLSVAVVNVIYDFMSKPMPDSVSAWAVWVGGATVVLVSEGVRAITA